MCPNCAKSFTGPKMENTPGQPPSGEMCGYLRVSFLDRMQAELQANEMKGDWSAREYDYATAAKELTQHVAKLLLSVRAGDRAKASEHAADVAVICMKISETHGDA